MGISEEYVSRPSQHASIPNSTNSKANILIDDDGNARLTGFSLLEITSDESTPEAEGPSMGTSIQWMSPELLVPTEFGLTERRSTKASDCYAFGMTMYEVLSGQIPFSQYYLFGIVGMVLEGRRPMRPQGAQRVWFTDSIWRMLEFCWISRPAERLDARTILLYLEGKLSPSNLPPGSNGDTPITQSDAASKNFWYVAQPYPQTIWIYPCLVQSPQVSEGWTYSFQVAFWVPFV